MKPQRADDCLQESKDLITIFDWGPSSTLKSRDITLPTKIHLVKAMVFPVVMYGCESWTVKKVEHQRIDAMELFHMQGLFSHSVMSDSL